MSGTVILPSLARTASPADVGVNLVRNGQLSSGVIVVIDVTAASATPSITVDLQYLDPAAITANRKISILTSAAITGVSNTIMRISPHLTAVANLTAQDIVPRQLIVSVTHDDADSITYSIGLIHA